MYFLLIATFALAGPCASDLDLVDTAKQAGGFTTLLTAVQQAELDDELRSAGPFTVLAPTDDAFARLPDEVLQSLLQPQNGAALRDVLLYHVLPGRLSAAKLLARSSAETVQESPVTVTVSEGRLRVGGAAVLLNDVNASNGVIHAIDTVLLPPGLTLVPPGAVGLIDLAVSRGVPLFNAGQPAACSAIYEVAAQSLLYLGKDELDERSMRRIEQSLSKIRGLSHPAQRAWELRNALDEARERMMNRETTTNASDHRMEWKTVFGFDDPVQDPIWFTVNDDVMGGISQASYETMSVGGVVFRGALSLENNGGFATIRSPESTLNLAGFDGLVIRVKGDGRTYGLSAMKSDRRNEVQTWRMKFTAVAGEWREIQIPFADLQLSVMGRQYDVPAISPEDIRCLAFSISDKNEAPFRLEIDWIRAYRSKTMMN